jgi:hypothetical protein
MSKCGCSIGEVTLKGCDNPRNMIPDMVLACFNICDGYGYSGDQVAKEWININRSVTEFLAQIDSGYEVVPEVFCDILCKDGSFVSFSLV